MAIRQRRAFTLALVLIAAFFATILWAQSYSQIQGLVRVQERRGAGYAGGPAPDRAAAAAQAIACLRVQLPPQTCRLTLGSGANQRVFSVNYVDRGSGLYDIEVTDGDLGFPPCPACDAGGP